MKLYIMNHCGAEPWWNNFVKSYPSNVSRDIFSWMEFRDAALAEYNARIKTSDNGTAIEFSNEVDLILFLLKYS